MKKSVEWDEFIVDVCDRFQEALGGTIMEHFNKLQQFGSLDNYLDRFEELKSLMIQRTPILPDTFFLIDSFIGGLKAHLKPFVKVLKPTILSDDVAYARLQGEAMEALKPQGIMLSLTASKAPPLSTHRPRPYQASPSNSVSRAKTALVSN